MTTPEPFEMETFCGDDITLVADPKQNLIFLAAGSNSGEYEIVNISLSLADAESFKSALDAMIRSLTGVSA